MRTLAFMLLLAGCGTASAPQPTPFDAAAPRGRVEGVVKGKDGPLANAFVCLTTGEPGGRPAQKDVLILFGRDGNTYPRVTVLRAGQTLAIQNDGPGHSTVSIEPLRNRRQIFSLAPGSGFGGMPFERSEFAIPIRCSDHSDGHGWIHVTDHPYSAVTDAEGKYSIDGIRAGTRELFAWHESAPKESAKATARVEPGETSKLDFTVESGR